MPLFYHNYVNYVLAHSVNYVITLYKTVWKIFDWNKEELANKYVPFGIDNFGNLICFDANNDKIVFVNHEDMSVEAIAENFDGFMSGLYE